jgi:hypothetical protein
MCCDKIKEIESRQEQTKRVVKTIFESGVSNLSWRARHVCITEESGAVQSSVQSSSPGGTLKVLVFRCSIPFAELAVNCMSEHNVNVVAVVLGTKALVTVGGNVIETCIAKYRGTGIQEIPKMRVLRSD